LFVTPSLLMHVEESFVSVCETEDEGIANHILSRLNMLRKEIVA